MLSKILGFDKVQCQRNIRLVIWKCMVVEQYISFNLPLLCDYYTLITLFDVNSQTFTLLRCSVWSYSYDLIQEILYFCYSYDIWAERFVIPMTSGLRDFVTPVTFGLRGFVTSVIFFRNNLFCPDLLLILWDGLSRKHHPS